MAVSASAVCNMCNMQKFHHIKQGAHSESNFPDFVMKFRFEMLNFVLIWKCFNSRNTICFILDFSEERELKRNADPWLWWCRSGCCTLQNCQWASSSQSSSLRFDQISVCHCDKVCVRNKGVLTSLINA